MQLLIKTLRARANFADNQFDNISGNFDVLPNFSFTTSETMNYYYLETCYLGVASQVAERLKTQHIRKLEKISKLCQHHGVVAYCSVFLPKEKLFQSQQKTLEKQKLNYSRRALFQVKARVSLKHFVTDYLWKRVFDYCSPQDFCQLISFIIQLIVWSLTLF